MKHMLAVAAALLITMQSFAQIEAMQKKVDIATQFLTYVEKGKTKKALNMIQPDTLKARPELRPLVKDMTREARATLKQGAELFISVTPNEEFTLIVCDCYYRLKDEPPTVLYTISVVFNNAEGEDISLVRVNKPVAPGS
ncbi:hypothetical protein MKQ68_12430 [Chitinophaga horti]|uniref:DUF3887 domain-containing protein n=1 Tax=Chitinophaga horti TaxID=2920382 RepID=A0ABY6J8I0_9BACT|nr:hypothetical protein [Chitinophaga horti]UYQ95907.1 hypothetical protein MKQ68_12430 [Chitinophaga horti]